MDNKQAQLNAHLKNMKFQHPDFISAGLFCPSQYLKIPRELA